MVVSDVVDLISDILFDECGERWPGESLIRYVNEGRLELLGVRKDALVKTVPFLLSASTAQEAPSDAQAVMSVIRNLGATGLAPGASITSASREAMDAYEPDWHNTTGSEVQHFFVDADDPTIFYVYPYVATNWYVELKYAYLPEDTDDPDDSLELSDTWRSALVNYGVWRALSKEGPRGDLGKAAKYYELYAGFIKAKSTADATSNPAAKQEVG